MGSPSEFIEDPATLYLSGFFFYGEGRDGYERYIGELPNGVALGDSDTDVLLKMGEPVAKRGRMTDRLLGVIQPAYRYVEGDAILSFEFGFSGRLELVCLCVEDVL